MFGYVRTDLPNMYVKDTVLYKAMYCGLCKSMGKVCGNFSRFTLNYDMTFLSLFCHNVAGTDVKVKKERCIAHWITKRPVAKPDALTERIAALNLILAYYKLSDDVIDEKKGKLKRKIFYCSYKRAKKAEPELNEIVKNNYAKLVEYEKTEGDSVDMSADSFGNMLSEIIVILLDDKATDPVKTLCYDLGKWVYLIDAVDDFDKDKKKNSFNVFVNLYKHISDKCGLIAEKRTELEEIFGAILSDIEYCGRQIDYKFNSDLINNILLCGLRAQTKKILENKKCVNTTKS